MKTDIEAVSITTGTLKGEVDALLKVVYNGETESDTLTTDDTTLISAAITPLTTAKRVKITVCVVSSVTASTATNFIYTIKRGDSTNLISFQAFTNAESENQTSTFVFVDSPNTTSAVTYNLTGKVNSSVAMPVATTKSITLEEVGVAPQ
jgi:hypothetical protein